MSECPKERLKLKCASDENESLRILFGEYNKTSVYVETFDFNNSRTACIVLGKSQVRQLISVLIEIEKGLENEFK